MSRFDDEIAALRAEADAVESELAEAIARAEAAEADDVADNAQIAELTSTVANLTAALQAALDRIEELENETDPDPDPEPEPEPEPGPLQVTVTNEGNGVVRVAPRWNGLTPVGWFYGRDGRDAGGWPANGSGWESPTKRPATQPSDTLTGMAAGTTYKVHIRTDEYGRAEATVVMPGSQPEEPEEPEPNPNTHVLHGAYTGFGLGGLSGFESMTQTPMTMPMHYIDTRDQSTLSSIYSWVSGNSDRHYLLSLNTLIGEPGNFASSSERSRCRSIANSINNAGLADRIIIRPMYEINANYGFPWQPFTHGNNFNGCINLFRDIYTEFKSVNSAFKIVWCIVPWQDNNADEEAVWPGGQYVDIVGLDVYNYWASGNPQQRWATVGARLQNGINYARSKGKPWSVDEWGNFTEAGDDPFYIEQMLTTARTANDCHSICFFNSGDGGVGWTLGNQPNSLAVYRREIAKF